MNQYLIKYLIDNATDDLAKRYLEYFKLELDWHIYNGNEHISNSYYRDHKIGFLKRAITFCQYLSAISFSSYQNGEQQKNILSTIPLADNNVFRESGYVLYSPVWHSFGKKNIFGDIETIIWHRKIQHLIRYAEFNSFLAQDLYVGLEDFKQSLFEKYHKKNFRALFLYTDQYFYSKFNIDIFKKLQKPSFVFSHGLPGVYSKNVDNSSNYLLVWGDKIRENYLACGFEPEKVKVIGNPRYNAIEKNIDLRSSLSQVLIVPVSAAAYHQHDYDQAVLTDPSMVVLYLYQVQSVLKRLGVKKARYRVHPSYNKRWVHSFLDHQFYTQDVQPLDASLKAATLVIGSTSTLLLESLIRGVNYLVYEPTDEAGRTMTNHQAVPPFDGSEKKVIVANNEAELEELIKKQYVTDYTLVHDYIQAFDPAVIKDLID